VNSPRRKPQGGAALIALAALIVLGVSWMLLSRLGAANRVAADGAYNARVLAEAKAALLGWVASNALKATEDNPGRLPCPQAWADIGTDKEGLEPANVITGAVLPCGAPAVGWLPWRTLGIAKPLDASGQQLWYMISPGWHNAGVNLTLNSNTAGQLTLDGALMVALIIAPGPALNLAPNANQVAAGCAARSQSQALSLPATPPNPLDFLECQNGTTADHIFAAAVVDNGVNRVFNDQVVGVTTGDVLPGLEAAISKRIERDIVPGLKAVYASAQWGVSSTNPIFAFAVPWASPGTSIFQGVAGTFQGLLPFSYSAGCNPLTDSRCTTTFVAWNQTPALTKTGGASDLDNISCSFTGTVAQCTGRQHLDGSLQLRMTTRASNVAMALRRIDATQATVECQSSGPWTSCGTASAAGTLDSSGSGTISLDVSLPFRTDDPDLRITMNIGLLADHALLNPADPTSGWFVRNEWYKLVYYAIAPNHAASGTAPRSCEDTTPTCLQVANVTPANKQRSILILAGRSLTGIARPNGTFADFLEGANADLDLAFEQRPVNSSFNDRVVVLDANP
jgi:hypothetical protein